MELLAPYIPKFILILLRAGISAAMLPFLGSGNIPAMFRIGLALGISMLLTPIVQIEVNMEQAPILVLHEAVLGAALAGITRALFYGIEMAGQLASTSMGLSIATVFNPEIGQSTEVSRLFGLIAILVFLAVDGHHDLIAILAKSYEVLPPGATDIKAAAFFVITSGQHLLVFALTVSAPAVVMMLIVNLLLGFLAKAAPQMNVFFVGYPVYIFAGFMVILIGMPVFIHALGAYSEGIRKAAMQLIQGVGR